jgi:hypothetical protein
MLKHGEVNPLNVFGLRQLNHCPLHFEPVQFDLRVNEKDITDWIYENLQGRFYIGVVDIPQSRTGNVTMRQQIVAFEHASEATYFSMFLTQINEPKVIW